MRDHLTILLCATNKTHNYLLSIGATVSYIQRGRKGESIAHLKEVEEICSTFQDSNVHVYQMRVQLFPLTLKDCTKHG